MPRPLFILAGVLALSACGGHGDADAPKPAPAAAPAQKTVFDPQLQALEKAKALKKQAQDEQAKQDQAIRDQGG